VFSAYIGKLGELRLGGGHAQVLTNLARQDGAGAAREDQGAAHRGGLIVVVVVVVCDSLGWERTLTVTERRGKWERRGESVVSAKLRKKSEQKMT
jgi:hypothetical protein